MALRITVRSQTVLNMKEIACLWAVRNDEPGQLTQKPACTLLSRAGSLHQFQWVLYYWVGISKPFLTQVVM